MKFLAKLERKFGRYAIPGLTRFIIGAYAIGYLFSFMGGGTILGYLTLEPGLIIFKGQVWRLLTWVLVPPSSFSIFTAFMLLFYFSVGTNLERTWGNFMYNVYIFGGMIFTVIGAFICYFIAQAGMQAGALAGVGYYFSTYYVSMSIFLAYAVTYPDMQILLYFIIPIKMKWMGIVYGVFLVYSCVQMNWIGRVAVAASLLNFLVFFLNTRNFKRITPREIKRKQTYKKAVQQTVHQPGQPRHKCAVCGRTEMDDPNLEFRYCSKCKGNFEYCQDHLFTHEHVK